MNAIQITSVPAKGSKFVIRTKANGDVELLNRVDIENSEFIFSGIFNGGRLLPTILFVALLFLVMKFLSASNDGNTMNLPIKAKTERHRND